jgi:hypothetical protein
MRFELGVESRRRNKQTATKGVARKRKKHSRGGWAGLSHRSMGECATWEKQWEWTEEVLQDGGW